MEVPSPRSLRERSERSLLQELALASADDDAATELLEWMRWGDEPECPRCGSGVVYRMRGRRGGRNPQRRWRCRRCKRQYTVRVGTVMENTKIPLRHWVRAYWGMCASKKGISAMQISRETGLSYKSAHFMMHRIRLAMHRPGARKLEGAVEADETYVGGRPYRRRNSARNPFKDGKRQWWTNKTPVLAVVERFGGQVRAEPVATVNVRTVEEFLARVTRRGGRLITDEARVYPPVGRRLFSWHHSVNHSAYQYADGDVHTNTIEGFFSIVKRGLNGIYHHVSKRHLWRYIAEFVFRYNTRYLDDVRRMRALVRLSEARRLHRADLACGPPP